MAERTTTMNEKEINEGKAIVLNRMYVGDYLDSNLGHEVINLFKADNNQHYIYLNATGNFAKEHQKEMGYMLFVKYYDKGLVEIIGMATGLKDVPGADMQLNRERKFDGIDEDIWQLQKNYIDAQTNEQGEKVGISYGGVSILDIFNNAEQQSVFVTYKANKVYRIKSSIRRFIRFSNADENSGANLPANEIIQLAEHQQAKASLKQYIYPSDSSDYDNLFALFNDSSLWEEVNVVDAEKLSIETQRKVSLFDICKIQNDENRFSNALAYFMERPEYYELWKEFFAKYGIKLKKSFAVAREESAKIESAEWNHNEKPSGGRIDLLIRDGENIVVIENKIKSDINTIATDGDDSTQLNRYVNYVNWLIENNDGAKPESHFIILTPSYNRPTIKDENMAKMYSIIEYADLYNFLKEHLFSFYNDANFVAFFEAMERHTHKNVNDYLYFDMLEKFIRRIKM